MGAGALLACAGLLLQLVTRNPLSGPETLGLSQGAALAGLAGLLIGVVPTSPLFALLAVSGSGPVVLCISFLSVRMSPERTALTGIAVAASLSAVSTVVVIDAKLQVAEALSPAGRIHAWPQLAGCGGTGSSRSRSSLLNDACKAVRYSCYGTR